MRGGNTGVHEAVFILVAYLLPPARKIVMIVPLGDFVDRSQTRAPLQSRSVNFLFSGIFSPARVEGAGGADGDAHGDGGDLNRRRLMARLSVGGGGGVGGYGIERGGMAAGRLGLSSSTPSRTGGIGSSVLALVRKPCTIIQCYLL